MRAPRVPVVSLQALAAEEAAEQMATRARGGPLPQDQEDQAVIEERLAIVTDPFRGARMVEHGGNRVWMTRGQQILAGRLLNMRQEDGPAGVTFRTGRGRRMDGGPW